MLMKRERELVVEYCRKLSEHRLTRGTGGNISILDGERRLFAISPSGMDYFEMGPEDVVVLDIDGARVDGDRKPSSETEMHRLLYQGRRDISAVVHTHSTFAATMACLGHDLPAVHYLVGYAGGDSVRCTPYAPFGSRELAEIARDGMDGRYAVLLSNHGLLAAGPDIQYAFDAAEEIEFVCELYWRAKSIGDPAILDGDQMKEVLAKFATYGQRGQD
ncbi:MAG: L-fuculose-phosphate aldolase [Synergistota bacterium]|nr:L-fuculose-phosphate aldolase [Synergistota bacterium]